MVALLCIHTRCHVIYGRCRGGPGQRSHSHLPRPAQSISDVRRMPCSTYLDITRVAGSRLLENKARALSYERTKGFKRLYLKVSSISQSSLSPMQSEEAYKLLPTSDDESNGEPISRGGFLARLHSRASIRDWVLGTQSLVLLVLLVGWFWGLTSKEPQPTCQVLYCMNFSRLEGLHD